MLQHVSEADSADSISCCVDVAAGILECTLNNKGRRIASFGRTRMIRACVSTLGLDVGNGAVLDMVSLVTNIKISVRNLQQ
jgi:hypothetical protein